MKAKDYQAMKRRLGLWDETAIAVGVAHEIDRAVRKARREEREKHCTCQTQVKCAYCDNRRSKGSRP